MDLVLDNLEGLICHKTQQTNKHKKFDETRIRKDKAVFIFSYYRPSDKSF